jgi:large subunit ribosomal protein L32
MQARLGEIHYIIDGKASRLQTPLVQAALCAYLCRNSNSSLLIYLKKLCNPAIVERLCLQYIYTLMAVPKKKTSKSKRDKRRATWVNKAAIQAKKALSLGKSVLTGRSTSFVYPQPDEEEAGE